MTCDVARELCSARLDEALDGSERAALDAHLAGCADCRRELDDLRRTVSVLRAVERPRAPAGFVDRVLATVRPVPWHRRLRDRLAGVRILRVPVEAAAVVVVASLAVYVFYRTPELQQAARPEAVATSDTRQDTTVPMVTNSAESEEPVSAASDKGEQLGRKEKPAGIPLSTPGATGSAPAVMPAPPVPPLETPKAERRSATAARETSRENVEDARTKALTDKARTDDVAPAIEVRKQAEGTARQRVQAPSPRYTDGPASAPRPAPDARATPPNTPPPVASPPASVSARIESTPPVPAPAPGGAAPPASTSTPPFTSGSAGRSAPAALSASPPSRPDVPAVAGSAVPEPQPPTLTSKMAVPETPAADVIGRLTVRDRAEAERDLTALFARVGAIETWRRQEEGVTLVEVAVPRERFAAFVSEIGRVGAWRAETRVADLPERVRVTLRIAQ